MSDAVEIREQPTAQEIYMFAGWRQWADAGSTSSGLPQYLIEQTGAQKIGSIRADGFYIFQIPGTHDLVRPIVKFKDGYPESLQTRDNELYYAEHNGRGILIFLGDEPQLDIERYVAAFLHVAKSLGVKRIVSFGGVYGELPYNKDRLISGIYSLPRLKAELEDIVVNLSDYHGGASVGSYICRRAGEQDIEFVSFYAFVPAYDFSTVAQMAKPNRGTATRLARGDRRLIRPKETATWGKVNHWAARLTAKTATSLFFHPFPMRPLCSAFLPMAIIPPAAR